MIFYKDLQDYILQERARLDALGTLNIPEAGIISRVLAPGPEQHEGSGVAQYPVTREVEELEVDAQGIFGDRHRRLTRPSSGREWMLYPKGVQIRQHRHVCVVSRDDCRVLSERLGVAVTPELLGANLLIDRLDGAPFSLSGLPPGTHLLVMPADAEAVPKPPIATLVHFVKQQGCGITGNAIAECYGDKGLVKAFREQGADHRGLICSIEYPVDQPARLRSGQHVAFKFSSSVAP